MHTTPDTRSLEHVVSRDGTPIAVWKSGGGPPLVLVHGAAADHSRWAPVLGALGEHFTVLALDRRGRGQSGDSAVYAIEREYEDVAAVAEWVGDQVSVLGHSYGAVCALEAARLTGAITRLVLYEGPLGFLQTDPDVVARLRALLDAGQADELLGLFMREVAGLTAEQVELLRSLPAWEARLAVAGTIPREEPREPRVRLRRRALPPPRRAHAAALGRRQPGAVQAGHGGAGRRAPRLPHRRDARPAPRRHGHRRGPVPRRGPRLPRARTGAHPLTKGETR